MKMVPTLNFGGTCKEALQMYEEAFKGKIEFMMTYREANDPAYNPLLEENQKDYIYHAEVIIGDYRIIASDHVDIEFNTCYSNFLTIMYDSKKKCKELTIS